MAQKNNVTAVSELVLALGLLVRRIRSSAPSELHGLTWTQKAVIVRLEDEGPATTAELARAEGVTPQSMGTALTTLEEMGLVERKAHPTDGRQINIKLTAKGAAIRKSNKEAKETWLSQAIAKLDKKEQATLFEAGEIIKRLVRL
jgi:DNA-binding MarR family transcriptional regulator